MTEHRHACTKSSVVSNVQQSDCESDFADDDTDKFCFYAEVSKFKIQVTKLFKDKIIILVKFFYNMPCIFGFQKLSL